jgi:hypothetical protein
LCFRGIADEELLIGHWASGKLETHLAVAKLGVSWAHDGTQAAAGQEGRPPDAISSFRSRSLMTFVLLFNDFESFGCGRRPLD